MAKEFDVEAALKLILLVAPRKMAEFATNKDGDLKEVVMIGGNPYQKDELERLTAIGTVLSKAFPEAVFEIDALRRERDALAGRVRALREVLQQAFVEIDPMRENIIAAIAAELAADDASAKGEG